MTKSKILVTGGAGFIGSNFIINSLKRFKTCDIVNLDKLTYAGNLNNLKEVQKNPRYRFVKGNISLNSTLKCNTQGKGRRHRDPVW